VFRLQDRVYVNLRDAFVSDFDLSSCKNFCDYLTEDYFLYLIPEPWILRNKERQAAAAQVSSKPGRGPPPAPVRAADGTKKKPSRQELLLAVMDRKEKMVLLSNEQIVQIMLNSCFPLTEGPEAETSAAEEEAAETPEKQGLATQSLASLSPPAGPSGKRTAAKQEPEAAGLSKRIKTAAPAGKRAGRPAQDREQALDILRELQQLSAAIRKK
jgi:hypothetical protein